MSALIVRAATINGGWAAVRESALAISRTHGWMLVMSAVTVVDLLCCFIALTLGRLRSVSDIPCKQCVSKNKDDVFQAHTPSITTLRLANATSYGAYSLQLAQGLPQPPSGQGPPNPDKYVSNLSRNGS